MIDKYKGQYTNAQLTIKERKMFLLVQIAEKERGMLFCQSYSIQSEGLRY
ncbi:MAG: hypothetical protein QXN78_04995 [Conexivisphaerales archaeon]